MSQTETTVQFPIGPYLGPKESDVSRATPLTSFMLALQERVNGHEASSMHGAVLWSAFPVERVVRDGLIIVLQRAAKTLRVRVNTPDQIEFVAQRIDKLVNAGLVVDFETMAEAAEAFDRQVVWPIKQVVRLGWKPGIAISAKAWSDLAAGKVGLARTEIRTGASSARERGSASSLWQIPSAMFFAKLMKAARLFGEEMVEAAEHDSQSNVFRHGKWSLPILHQDHEIEFWSQNFLRLEDERLKSYTELIWRDELFGTRNHLARRAQLLAAIKQLRIDLSSLPESAFDVPENMGVVTKGPEMIGNAWVSTQILHTVLGNPVSGALSMNEYVTAKRMLDACDADELAQQVMDNLKKAQSLPDRHEEVLRGFVKAQIRQVRKFSHEVEHHTQQVVFIKLEVGYGFAENPVDALSYLKGEHDGFTGVLEAVPEADRDKLENELFIEGVPWDMMGLTDFVEIMEAASLSTMKLVTALERMDPAIHRRGVLALLRHDPSEKLVDEVVKRELVDITADMVVEFHEHMPEKVLEDWVWTLRDWCHAPEPLVLALCQLSEETVRTLMWEPELRGGFLDSLIRHIDLYGSMEKIGLRPSHRDVLLRKMGRDLWVRYILMHTVLTRECDFYPTPAPSEQSYTPRWEDLPAAFERADAEAVDAEEGYEPDGLFLPMNETLEATPEELREILATYSELDVFEWTIEHLEPEKAAKRRQDFIALREWYYRESVRPDSLRQDDDRG